MTAQSTTVDQDGIQETFNSDAASLAPIHMQPKDGIVTDGYNQPLLDMYG